MSLLVTLRTVGVLEGKGGLSVALRWVEGHGGRGEFVRGSKKVGRGV